MLEQIAWPFGWLSQMEARTKAAPALASGGTTGSVISRNLMKYMWQLSFARSAWQDWSSARILVQMKTRICRSSSAVAWRSFSTYGKIPTLSASSTAQLPRSRNRPSSTSARSR